MQIRKINAKCFSRSPIFVIFASKTTNKIQAAMLQYTIKAPSRLRANVALPPSKSISNRALIIHALAGGARFPENISDCDDTKVVVRALETMPDVIDVRASGSAMRFLTAYLSVTPGEHTLTGAERMKHRPIGVLVDALRRLGADIDYLGEEGFPPLRIRGRDLEGGRLEVPADVSSQYVSALLMIGPALKQGLTVKLLGTISSRPYIDLTLHVMHDYGADAQWTDVDTIAVGPKPYVANRYVIEGDWSAASYWYEMLILNGDNDSTVSLGGLSDGSRQGDSMVRYIGSLFGLRTSMVREVGEPLRVVLAKGFRPVQRLDYDFSNCPDLAQTFIVACAALGVPFRFSGLGSLKIKETDRIEAMKTELKKMGVVVRDHNDVELIWEGGRCEPTWEPFDTYGDHRMAMSLAPLAMVRDEIKINNPQVVSKSYPRFWDDLRQAGFIVE